MSELNPLHNQQSCHPRRRRERVLDLIRGGAESAFREVEAQVVGNGKPTADLLVCSMAFLAGKLHGGDREALVDKLCSTLRGSDLITRQLAQTHFDRLSSYVLKAKAECILVTNLCAVNPLARWT